ncbi:MAG TPA: hypothetical protein VHY79_06260 [Rhizomicrobium sp.]|nr:hypothetical protein [Rhizomicrobium sp.]
MFRCALLVTTAFVVVGSLSFAAAQSAAVAQPATAGPGRDRNNDFLCTYGQFDVSLSHSANSAHYQQAWTHVAVPITGRGQTVDGIVVKEGHSANTYGNKFLAGVYSNAASGMPGGLLSGGMGRAPKRCGTVTIPIAPIKLENNKTYWIEEMATLHGHHTDILYWAINPKTKHKAYVQHYSSSSGTQHTSPWTKQSSGPWFRLK